MATLASHINHKVLAAIAPRAPIKKIAAQQAIISTFGAMLPGFLARFDVSTPLRIAHFLAQLAHESDGFCTLEEYASGAAYEGRKDLGNIKAGDGQRYKGRALIQLTGRDNYRAFTSWVRRYAVTSIDFEARPELVATWPWAAWATLFFWSTKGLNSIADRDDLVLMTKRINGGRNGLDDRASYLRKSKKAVAEIQAKLLNAGGSNPVLRRGSRTGLVDDLQRSLRSAGYYHLTIDGIFGAATEQAVRSFQRANSLVADGIVGNKTWAALRPFQTESAA